MAKGDKVKFRVDQGALNDAVTWTARTLPQRPAIAVLAGVRITASDGQVTLSSFDYEVSATSHVEADVDAAGEVLVSGRLLASICKNLPSKPVSVTLDGSKLRIVCGAAKFTLASMPLDTYPHLPDMPATIGHADADALAKAVGQVASAAATDDTLPLLTTIHLDFTPERIVLMATDRYRLAVRTLEWSAASDDIEMAAIVKAKTLQGMTNSSGGAGEAAISLATATGAPQILGIDQAGRQMTSQLVDGDYPPVAKLFPDSSLSVAVVDRQEMLEALNRVALVADRSAPVRLTFTEGGLTLNAGQSEDAQAQEELPCHLEGEDIESAYNPGFLRDGLKAIEDPYVRLAFTQPAKPVVITGQEAPGAEDSQQLRYLLMPIRYF